VQWGRDVGSSIEKIVSKVRGKGTSRLEFCLFFKVLSIDKKRQERQRPPNRKLFCNFAVSSEGKSNFH
jgi:hypothetical protein